MFLGIEIGGTKLQLGLGPGDGTIQALWRGTVEIEQGGEGIRRQIVDAIPELLASAGIALHVIRGVGVGFGGPTDDATNRVVKSHHISGWDGFPLANWIEDVFGMPAVICNDADVAGLAEALFGTGKGLSPIFYITVGSGIGGGLIINGEIYRGVGLGAAEIGHVRPVYPNIRFGHDHILEEWASGWGITRQAVTRLSREGDAGPELQQVFAEGRMTALAVANAARQDDPVALAILDDAVQALAEGIGTVIKLLCPRRIIIGGGVSLIGEELFFAPLRRYIAERGFAAFAGLTDIMPAILGEEVVVHGALALARRKFSR